MAIYKSLKNPSGSFLMFSRYTTDLTKHNAYGYDYNVYPSAFIMCDIDFSNLGGDLNESVPNLFNNFESLCGANTSPKETTNIFWELLMNNGVTQQDMLYKGSINQESYNVINGMGYSDIYCYIPNHAKRTSYNLDKNGIGDVIKEYNDGFTSNCIILLYNIGDDIKDVPMGIYFPGTFIGSEMSNKIQKNFYKNSIGTSYGVRICYRMTPFTEDNNITLSEDTDSGLLSQLLSSMSESMSKMNDILQKEETCDTSALKETYNMFRNSRTNVPYPIELNDGRAFWFVNGRNTGIQIPNAYFQPYSGNLEDKFKEWSEDINMIATIFNVFCCDLSGKRSYSTYDKTSSKSKLYINVNLYENGAEKDVDSIIIEVGDERKTLNRVNGVFVLPKEGLYKITTGDNKYTENIDVKLYYPSYYGVIDNKYFNYLIENKYESPLGLTKFISPSSFNRITFNTGEKVNELVGNKLVYIVPATYNDVTHIIDRTNMDNIVNQFNTYNINLHGEPYIMYTPNNDVPYGRILEIDFTDETNYIEII